MSSQISLCWIHENTVIKVFQEGKVGNLGDEVTHQKAISKNLLSSYYVRISPFSPWAPMGSQISLGSFHEKSVSTLVPEVYVVSLWDELTDQKEVSQKASFTFWTDEISFITVGLNAIQRSPSQFPQRQCEWRAPRNISVTLWDEFTHHQETSKKASF